MFHVTWKSSTARIVPNRPEKLQRSLLAYRLTMSSRTEKRRRCRSRTKTGWRWCKL